jgi:hypothetical protein
MYKNTTPFSSLYGYKIEACVIKTSKAQGIYPLLVERKGVSHCGLAIYIKK